MKLREMILVAMFTALTAVLAQVSIPIPFSPVPITMQTFAVCLAAGILGAKLASLSMTVYMLLGAVGAPVFSQGKGGLPVILGPTGGYIWGFIIAAALIGWIIERHGAVNYKAMLVAMFAGLLVIYTTGTAQLAVVAGLGPWAALAAGAGWYLPLDVLKLFLAAGVSYSTRNALVKSGLLSGKPV